MGPAWQVSSRILLTRSQRGHFNNLQTAAPSTALAPETSNILSSVTERRQIKWQQYMRLQQCRATNNMPCSATPMTRQQQLLQQLALLLQHEQAQCLQQQQLQCHDGHNCKSVGKHNRRSSSGNSHNNKMASTVRTRTQQEAVKNTAGPSTDSPLCHNPQVALRQLLHLRCELDFSMYTGDHAGCNETRKECAQAL